MKVVEGDVIKFGRVRFRVKKLVIDSTDVLEPDNKDQSLLGSSLKKSSGVLTTLEDNNAPINGILAMSNDTFDIRNLGRGETMAGFDNRPFDFDDPKLRLRE